MTTIPLYDLAKATTLESNKSLITMLVGQVIDRLAAPNGIIAFDLSSFPKRGTHSVGVKRHWCGHQCAPQ